MYVYTVKCILQISQKGVLNNTVNNFMLCFRLTDQLKSPKQNCSITYLFQAPFLPTTIPAERHITILIYHSTFPEKSGSLNAIHVFGSFLVFLT